MGLIDGRARRVLVVDDEKLIADTITTILNQSGFEAASAYGGKAAIEKARDWNPDVLLCDVVMPGMNGIEAAIEVCALLPDCKVLLFSGQADILDLLKEAHARGRDFELLRKPLHPSELLERLRTIS